MSSDESLPSYSRRTSPKPRRQEPQRRSDLPVETSDSSYARRKASERRQKEASDRRRSINSGFVKQFVDSKNDIHRSNAQAFNLSEIIDPKNIGKKKFIHDSDKARNLDETNVKKAREGAKEILADAIEKAKTKSVQIREEARRLGYEEGHQEGHQEGFKKGEIYANQELSPLFKTFEDHVRELSNFRRKMYGKVEREIIEMVTALGKRVIHHELNTREGSIQKVIRMAVESVLDKENMTIKIHPADKEYAEKFRPELQQLFNEIKNITFEGAPALERGGCVIETNFGTIDARLEHLNAQIDKILTLAPVTFDAEQTQFPATESEEIVSKKEASSQPGEEVNFVAEEKAPIEEDNKNTDDFEPPDFTSLEQQV